MASVEHAFGEARSAVEALHPDLSKRLSEPASEAQIDSFEQETGIRLPDPVRLLYRQANGCNQGDGIFGGWEWIAIEFVGDHVAELQTSLESDRPDEAEAMTLLPLFHSNGDYLCIRHNEDAGKLYYVPHDEPTVEPVFETLAEFFVQFVARIATGELVFKQFSTRHGNYFSVSPPNREYRPPDFELLASAG
ncbi:SMI1/KNR4 family protein [Massilia sp. DJPM01]|uniref:SMI1/KNR4 family protein n=1 Tax=Massilia sp. DJPM01 TaxID=3024404 RepID=UPI00259D96BF|nr:SMI1/KNR4 family protein [Massilia sp. DJPM01]MDM5177849.1 SMI1/KNR4 family protein [Massilia sp. DJPM01]